MGQSRVCRTGHDYAARLFLSSAVLGCPWYIQNPTPFLFLSFAFAFFLFYFYRDRAIPSPALLAFRLRSMTVVYFKGSMTWTSKGERTHAAWSIEMAERWWARPLRVLNWAIDNFFFPHFNSLTTLYVLGRNGLIVCGAVLTALRGLAFC